MLYLWPLIEAAKQTGRGYCPTAPDRPGRFHQSQGTVRPL